MTKPEAEAVPPERVLEYALATVTADRFPVLATVERGLQPRVRPVSPVRTEGFTVYVANLRDYNKTAEIAANPNVELCYVSEQHDQVRLSGLVEVVPAGRCCRTSGTRTRCSSIAWAPSTTPR